MYLPPAFREDSVDIMHDFIRANPLATLVTVASNGLVANHIPLLLDPEPKPHGTLTGHLARGNSQWRDFAPDTEALVIFAGPDHYISPNWYASKEKDGKVVPTWNYAAVHAYGPLQIHEDADWLRSLVTRLTDTHEAAFDQPWKVADAPPDYIDGLLRGIVGIEIPIARLEGKWKMSQNRTPADRAGAVAGLIKLASKTEAT